MSVTSEVKKITIYWDSSYSMNEKVVDKELVFLEAYFKSIKNAQVRLITFSNSIDVNTEFSIINGNWGLLKKQLISTRYEGIAFYGLLDPKFDSDVNLLFTDGNGVFDKLSLKNHTTTYIISTQSNSNNIVLGQESRKAKGEHINLNQYAIKNALSILGIEAVGKIKYKAKKTKKALFKGVFSGIISDSKEFLKGVSVRVKYSKNGVVTGSNGMFKI
ncbi:MAG: hypothetical protein JKY69_06770, partial [Flavobacteriaceae bacterium]|nr:hypothetical protein [Flavobacteriaceae bacterium]